MDNMKESNCKALKYARIYDNGGKTADRYLVRLYGSVYTMSDDALMPNGVNMYFGEEHEFDRPWSRFGKKVSVKDLPDAVRIAICRRAKR
jgi:hypothetical protein